MAFCHSDREIIKTPSFSEALSRYNWRNSTKIIIGVNKTGLLQSCFLFILLQISKDAVRLGHLTP